MRERIRSRLTQAVPAVDGRVYEAHEAASAASADKPYLVLAMGPETLAGEWAGLTRQFDVTACGDAALGFAEVDEVADAVVAALLGQRLPGADPGDEAFTCLYLGAVGVDTADASGVVSRALRFAVPAIRPAAGGSVPAAEPDEWLEAMAEWTVDALGSEWRVYTGSWPQGYEPPAVLWRVAQLTAADAGAAAVEVRKRLVAHAVGRTPEERDAGVRQLAGRLRRGEKVPLSLAERRYLTVRETASADLQADAWTAGQLTVWLSRRESRPHEEAPLMQEVGWSRDVR